jgi:hypothetical protein
MGPARPEAADAEISPGQRSVGFGHEAIILSSSFILLNRFALAA